MRTRAACASNASRNASTSSRRDRQARPRRGGRRGAAGAARRRAGRRAGRTRGIERPEPVPSLAVERDQDRRPVVALGDARGDDPDHARVPALARRARRRGRVAELAHLRLGLEEDPLLDVAPLGVGGVELLRDRAARALSSVSSSSSPASARCRRPAALMRGASRKPTRAASSPLGSTRATRISARRPGLRVARQRAQAGAHEPAVLAAQRHEVGDRRERDEVEVVVGQSPGPRPRAAQQRLRELVARRPPRTGPGTGSRRARVHDRRVGQRAVGARLVVVGDDDVDARARARSATSSTAVIAQSTVTSSCVPRSASRSTVARGEAVAVVDAAGQEPVDVGAERAQRAHQDRRRAHAVDVVVAVDRDARAARDVAEDQLRQPRRARRSARAACALLGRQERARRVRLAKPAPHEHLRERASTRAPPQAATAARSHRVDRIRASTGRGR